MSPSRNPTPKREYEDRLRRFQKLMARRVHNLLLVATAYDSFILEEEGQLDELILNEFTDLNMSMAPSMRRVAQGGEALEILQREPFDLVITTGNLGDMTLEAFLEKAHAIRADLPVVLLVFDTNRLPQKYRPGQGINLAGTFVWQGDFRILLAIVKQIEDRWNVDQDTALLGVSVIILIEDSIRYYSSFLPTLYTELMTQSQRVIQEGLNLTHKVMRMRARPKILLNSTYEEAWPCFERYRDHLIGIISDVEFPKEGEKDSLAGFEFARRVRAEKPDLPIMLQTRDARYARRASEVQAESALKGSPMLLHDLREFVLDNFGFGEFVFRLPSGEEVGRAKDLRMLEKALKEAPVESILFHAERNHFSTWLRARTEFSLAKALKPIKASDFGAPGEIREYLVESICEFRRDRQSGGIAVYSPDTFDTSVSLAKIGSGSIGGKARGLAFLRQLIYSYRIRNRVPGVRIVVPSAVVLATDIFDQFLDSNHLRDYAMQSQNDRELTDLFLRARLPRRAQNRLKGFLEQADYPLAVRSSSLLEDSQYQPFAGIYSTFMLPNNDPDFGVRLRALTSAIKRVYASTFFRQAKEHMESTPFRLEEEKMGVLVQRLVGARRAERFYPEISGVAQSYNFYPNEPMKPEDGLVSVALGLGEQVVAGGRTVRFCPKYPRHLPEFSTPRDMLRHSQRRFFALDMTAKSDADSATSGSAVGHYPIDDALRDGALDYVGSIYSHENNSIYDGLSRAGTPVVTFAPVLKYSRFPLPETTELLLDFGKRGMNSPVYLEFAVNLSTPQGQPPEFACLQMRPFVHHREAEDLVLEAVKPDEVICWSNRVLGNGSVDDIRDLVVVDRERFDRARSREAAAQVSEITARLSAAATPFVLIGVGRWGASDPWLGIPVNWEQIYGARAIVEAGFRDVSVTPSQGSHFFHNLTSASVGYFSVDFEMAEGYVDWEWLLRQPAEAENGFVRHVRLAEPILIKMRGADSRGIIFKPGHGRRH